MGGEEWGQEKLSHQKNLISHSNTHENGGREDWVAGNGCECSRMCVCEREGAKGFILRFFLYHTLLSADMFACFFFSFQDQHLRLLLTTHRHR